MTSADEEIETPTPPSDEVPEATATGDGPLKRSPGLHVGLVSCS